MTEIDPNDAAAWYWLGSTVTDPEDPRGRPGREQAQDSDRALHQGPRAEPLPDAGHLQARPSPIAMPGRPTSSDELLDRWKKMDPERLARLPGPGDLAGEAYGEMGRYATVIDPFRRPVSRSQARRPARFEAARAADGQARRGRALGQAGRLHRPMPGGGRVRARFGAAVAAFDADGDGRLDLYLASAVVGPKGIRDVLLLNKGDGRFEDASAASGSRPTAPAWASPRPTSTPTGTSTSSSPGVGDNRLLRNRDGKAVRGHHVAAQAGESARASRSRHAGSTSTRTATSTSTS